MPKIQPMFSPDEDKLLWQEARKLYHQWGVYGSHTIEDLLHLGTEGLLKARMNFNDDLGDFLTYAALRVRGAIKDALRKDDLIRRPQALQESSRDLNKARNDFQQLHQKEPDDQQLADFLGWPLEQLHTVISQQPKYDEADTGRGFDGGEENKTIQLKSQGNAPEENIQQQEFIEVIKYCIEKRLDSRDRIILISRYGLFGREELQVLELAAQQNCGEANIYERAAQARNRIKSCLEENGLKTGAEFLKIL